jgi:lipopolysaccharide export system permease protein
LQIKPDQLSLRDLYRVTDRLNWQSEQVLAPYRTQILYLWTYPLSILVLTIFALVDGTSHYRKNAAVGVFNAIFVLIAFFLLLYIFQAMGRGDRLPAWLATTMPLGIFAVIGIARLGPKFGWYPLKYIFGQD